MTDLIPDGLSNAELGALYAKRLEAYIAKRKEKKDFPMYNGRLNKSKIAEELGFGRSVWTQNPACKQMIVDLEADLGVEEGASPAGLIPGQGAADRRVRDLEKRVNRLEVRCASLQAENAELREQLRKIGWMDKHLPETGRLPW